MKFNATVRFCALCICAPLVGTTAETNDSSSFAEQGNAKVGARVPHAELNFKWNQDKGIKDTFLTFSRFRRDCSVLRLAIVNAQRSPELKGVLIPETTGNPETEAKNQTIPEMLKRLADYSERVRFLRSILKRDIVKGERTKGLSDLDIQKIRDAVATSELLIE
jgi:hypothetical protein